MFNHGQDTEAPEKMGKEWAMIVKSQVNCLLAKPPHPAPDGETEGQVLLNPENNETR
jgi:hypothetical protein